MSERWMAIPGFAYDISNDGRVRSWISWRGGPVPHVLAAARDGSGRFGVQLHKLDGTNRRAEIHVLVAEAFLGPRPPGNDIRHLDGNPDNNRLENLAYGTKSENQKDSVRHGTHASTAKTECKNGHPLSGPNVYMWGGKRHCRTCRRLIDEAWRLRRRARKAA